MLQEHASPQPAMYAAAAGRSDINAGMRMVMLRQPAACACYSNPQAAGALAGCTHGRAAHVVRRALHNWTAVTEMHARVAMAGTAGNAGGPLKRKP